MAGSENSSAYFVTWMQSNASSLVPGDIAGRFVSVGGAIQPDIWLGGGNINQPVVAGGPNGDYLVVYMKYSTSTYDIWGRLVGNRVYLPLVRR